MNKTSLKLTWMAGAALVAGSGCLVQEQEQVREPVAMMAIGDVDHVDTLRGLSVDRATYDALVSELGSAPRGLALDGNAPDGTVALMLAPTSPLVTGYLEEPAAMPPLSIAFDDGSDEPVALLLPAIQKVREAAMQPEGSSSPLPGGTITIGLDGEPLMGLLLPAVQKIREAAGPRAGDDRPATIAAFGTHVPGVSPEQRYQMGDAFVAPTGLSAARFVDAGGGFAVGELGIADPYLAGRWRSAAVPMNLVVDLRMDGRVLRRMRVPRAQPSATGQAPSAEHVSLNGLGAMTRSGDAERAMFDAGYATFSSDAFDTVRRMLINYGGATSMSLGISRWNAGRPQALADIIVGAGPGGGPGYEAMACTAALPTALAVASALDLGQPERASAAATVEEALTAISPSLGLVVGGELAVQALGAPAPTGDAELACAAVRQLAALPDTAATAEGVKLRELALDLKAFDARRLEIELAAWVEAMDAIVAAPDETAWAAARAKADILIEALAQASTHSETRWQLAATLLGR